MDGRRLLVSIQYCVISFQLGAEAVNLAAGDKPADVYSGIASRLLHALLYEGLL